MKFVLFYYDDCPGLLEAKAHLEAAFADLKTEFDIDATYATIDVMKFKQEHNGSLMENFYGSPTINVEVDGKWVDLFGQTGVPIFACRNYTFNSVETPYATKDMILKKLRRMISLR